MSYNSKYTGKDIEDAIEKTSMALRAEETNDSTEEWNGMAVWLSSENQFNYKAAFDLAVQTSGGNLPVTFKFGTTQEPVYHTFSEVGELTDFYIKAMGYINGVLADGWKEKDSIEWNAYETLLNN